MGCGTMFYFKDIDGNEHGPISLEQIQTWIHENRMNEGSLIRLSRNEEWVPLIQVQELQGLIGGDFHPDDSAQLMTSFQLEEPGNIKAIGVMTLIGGILSLFACVWVASATFFLWIAWIYSLVLGIKAISLGSKMMRKEWSAYKSARTIAVMQIVNIISCDPTNLVLGIVTLVFLKDLETKAFLLSKGIKV